MRPILDQLDNDPAILLAYLSDELSTVERQQVERRLAAEPALRDELENLRAAQQMVWGGLAALDASQPLSGANGGNGATERSLSRLMRQWQVDRARRPDVGAGREPRSSWWWLYSAAAAAILIIGYTVWWGFQPADNTNLATTRDVPSPPEYVDRGRMVAPYDPADSTALADAERDLDDVEMLRTMIQ